MHLVCFCVKTDLKNNANWLSANGLLQFFQISANYENLDYFIRSEVNKMLGKAGLAPDMESYYISIGYNFYPYTAYMSFSKKNLHFDHIANEIPVGVSAELDMLSATYTAIANTFNDDQSEGVKFGVRWDWRPNLAFKAELTFVIAGEKVSNDYALNDLGNFDGQVVLYQLGAEWVF